MLRNRILHTVLALVLAGGSFGLQAGGFSSSGRAAGSPARATATAILGAQSVPKREVFGFALASSLTDPTVGYPSWNFSALSTVAFFGVHIDTLGYMVADSGWSVWRSSAMTSLLAVAHAAGTKVVLTIILQDFSPGTPTMCAGLSHRDTTVVATVSQVIAQHVDGVNVDFEGLNGTCPNGQTTRAMFTDFVHKLRLGLPAGSYLSVDTYASSAADSLGFFNVQALNAYVDSFFVMAYDLEYSNYYRSPANCASFCLGPTAPLSGYYYNDTSIAAQYISAVGASKVILGVPYYGRKSCVGGVVPNAYPTGAVVADTYISASGESTDPAVTRGSYTAHRDVKDPAGLERWDTWFNASLGCTRELYWDDVTSLGYKYDLVNRDGLRGVGIWNLNYGGGAPELWAELYSHIRGCTAVLVSASPAAGAPVGASVAIEAAPSGCISSYPSYQFWVQAPGTSVWSLARGYGTSPAFAWSTVGKVPGVYRFNVWIRDRASAGVYGNALGRWDAFASFTYVVRPPPCSSVSASLVPYVGTTVGSSVTITAAAAPCPNPRFQFWVLTPGATAWRLARAYSTSRTYTWKAGPGTGVYRWSVWARDASSPGVAGNVLGSWDGYAASQYVVTVPCVLAGVATSPSAAAVHGATVAITAAATACSHPLYAFYVLRPGSSTWSAARAYSASPTFDWNTSGLPAGLYRFAVWTRDAYSNGTGRDLLGSWDGYGIITFTLS